MTRLNTIFLAGLVAINAGCGAEDEGWDLEAEELELADDPVAEILDNLHRAGFPDAEIEVLEDETVIVGGDAVVSLEASREMIGRYGNEEPDEDDLSFRQYRTNNLVAGSVDTICIDGSAFSGSVSTALDDAIDNYNDLDLTFDLVRTTGNAPGCDALITANLMNGTSGSAGFPSGGLPFDTINIGDDIVTTFGLDEAEHVITHEIGHCIGFRHTDYYNRSISCSSGSNEGSAGVGAVHIPGTPTTAVYNGSVMNACYNSSSTGEWTANDLIAINALYSPAEAPVAPKPLSKLPAQCYGLYDLEWASMPNATSYQLYRSTSSSFSSPVKIYDGSGTNWYVNVSSGTWYLRARACNANGCSGWSNQVSASRLNYCF